MQIISDGKILLRTLEREDRYLLLDWLSDVNVLDYWEGRTVKFDVTRVEEDFFSEEACEMERAIIVYDDVPIGYIQIYIANDILDEYSYISDKNVYALDLFIANVNFRGKGIGTKLLYMVKDYIKQKGGEVIIVDPHTDNLRALHVYEKVGFKIIKTLKAHEMHDGKLVDCYLMECDLTK